MREEPAKLYSSAFDSHWGLNLGLKGIRHGQAGGRVAESALDRCENPLLQGLFWTWVRLPLAPLEEKIQRARVNWEVRPKPGEEDQVFEALRRNGSDYEEISRITGIEAAYVQVLVRRMVERGVLRWFTAEEEARWQE